MYSRELVSNFGPSTPHSSTWTLLERILEQTNLESTSPWPLEAEDRISILMFMWLLGPSNTKTPEICRRGVMLQWIGRLLSFFLRGERGTGDVIYLLLPLFAPLFVK